MVEQPHAAVGAGENDLAGKIAPRLLQRHIRLQPRDGIGIGRTVMEHEGRVPFLGDHPIGALFRREMMTESHQAVDPLTDLDGVDRHPDTALIDVEALARDMPALAPHAAQQRPEKAQPRLVRAAEPLQPHHEVRRAQGNSGEGPPAAHGPLLRQTRMMWM